MNKMIVMSINTIVIATDFSEAARNATRYGLRLAKTLHARVVLAGAFQEVPVPVIDAPVILTPADTKAWVERRLHAEADRWASEEQMTVDIVSREGPTAKVILDVAKEREAGLIITGQKDRGNAVRKLFGSTVTRLAQKTHVPLIVVPEGAVYTTPRAIALANDMSESNDIHTLDMLHLLTETLHSKLYIVRVIVRRSEEVVEILKQYPSLEKMTSDLEPVLEYPIDKDIPRALDKFVSGHQVDLLAMLPHHHSAPENWFVGSVTREMIFIAKIPLLILPDLRT